MLQIGPEQLVNKLVPERWCQALADEVLDQVEQDSTFQPTVLLLLGMGGYTVGAYMNEPLGIDSQDAPGVPILKKDGHYYPDPRFPLELYVADKNVMLVDDSLDRGVMQPKMIATVLSLGALSARSSTLIANKHGVQTDYVGAQWDGKPPDFFWKALRSRKPGR